MSATWDRHVILRRGPHTTRKHGMACIRVSPRGYCQTRSVTGWYYLEGDRSGVKEFLKCRTVGLCMTHNRLLNFHVVRSTKPVTFTPADFVAPRGIRIPREQSHMNKHPAYPDTLFYLSHSGKYFFRHPDLRHLRIEQVSAAALSVIIDWGLLSCSFRAVAKTEVQSGDPRTARSYSPLISPVSPRL